MHGLDVKRLLIGSLKLRQQKYLKIFVLVILIVFNFRYEPAIHSSEVLLPSPQHRNKQSFVSKALNVSGDAVVTIETQRKIISSSEGLFWKMGKDRTRHEKVIATWLGKRGGAGKMPPRGFPKPPKFN